MADKTVIIRRKPQSFAFLFWIAGPRRGDFAALQTAGTTIGRGREADIVLDDDTVSGEQARIRFEQGQWFLIDLAAANRTLVQGAPVVRQPLDDGTRITFGTTDMVFRVLG